MQNRNVDAAERTIHSIIKNKFIERGVFPAASWQNIGYLGNDLSTLIFVFACEAFLHSDRNIERFVRNYTIPPHLEYNTVDDYQKLGDFVLGKGNPEERNSMRIVYEQLIHDRLIFSAILSIDNGLQQLQQRS